jgi:hypothetical protein
MLLGRAARRRDVDGEVWPLRLLMLGRRRASTLHWICFSGSSTAAATLLQIVEQEQEAEEHGFNRQELNLKLAREDEINIRARETMTMPCATDWN